MNKRLAVFMLSVCLASFHSGAQEVPNVVFIMADDLGWADVGFHGGLAPTPVLDDLAAKNLELTQHYVAPVCSPTRAGLLTGRYWSRFGITTPTNERALPPETVTLATALRGQGYQTCLVGKWHLGSTPQSGPNRYGFDHAYGSLAGGVTPWSHRYKKGPFIRTWHRNGELLDESGHVTDLLTTEAVRWIQSRDRDPFFLYVPFTAVHLPLNEPQAWLDRVPAKVSGEVERQYVACVMHLDDSIGQILAALDRNGLRKNTLIVVTSDNGGSTAENNNQPYPDDNCPDGKLPGNNRPFRGQKGSVYEGGTRVPTIISWPGKLEPRKEATPVAIIDWMPTLCTLAGFKIASNLKWDGIDLSSLLLRGDPLPERNLYLAGPRKRAVSLRTGRWKLVVTGDREKQTVELFDLSNDPEESVNLADREPVRVREMRRTLETASAADGDAAVGRP